MVVEKNGRKAGPVTSRTTGMGRLWLLKNFGTN